MMYVLKRKQVVGVRKEDIKGQREGEMLVIFYLSRVKKMMPLRKAGVLVLPMAEYIKILTPARLLNKSIIP